MAQQTARMPRRFPLWLIILPAAGVLIAGLAIIIVLNLPSTQRGAILRMETPITTAELRVVLQKEISTPEPQLKQETPVTVLPLLKVEWTPKDPEVAIPSREQGRYNGTNPSSPTSETQEITRQILRSIGEDLDEHTVFLSLARAQSNHDVVLAGMFIMDMSAISELVETQGPGYLKIPLSIRPKSRLFLSVDGEKSWREIKLFVREDVKSGIASIGEVRVVVHDDNSILLLVAAEKRGVWRQATTQLTQNLP